VEVKVPVKTIFFCSEKTREQYSGIFRPGSPRFQFFSFSWEYNSVKTPVFDVVGLYDIWRNRLLSNRL